jgi:hypothetical protein
VGPAPCQPCFPRWCHSTTPAADYRSSVQRGSADRPARLPKDSATVPGSPPPAEYPRPASAPPLGAPNRYSARADSRMPIAPVGIPNRRYVLPAALSQDSRRCTCPDREPSLYPAPGLTRDLFPKQEPLYPPISKAPGHKHLLHLALPLKCHSPGRGTRFHIRNNLIT